MNKKEKTIKIIVILQYSKVKHCHLKEYNNDCILEHKCDSFHIYCFSLLKCKSKADVPRKYWKRQRSFLTQENKNIFVFCA